MIRTMRRFRFVACPLCLALLAAPSAAADGGPSPSTSAPTDSSVARAAPAASSVETSLEQARGLIKDGDYDRAVESLKGAIRQAAGDVGQLRDAYLLLIKTYVFLGNDLKFRPQGREASNLNYKAARELIAECLKVKALRHTQPAPASEYPPEMVSLFAEVRAETFGSFRVLEMEPRNATVQLDADTMRAASGDGVVGDVDLPVGPHLVVVRAPGRQDVTDHINISPNATLERSYALPKRRTGFWYATRGLAAAGVVGGVIALASRGGTNGAKPLGALPGPPGPPTP